MITTGSSRASDTGPEGAAGPRPRVAVLGTGIMGGAMARNLIRAGLRDEVWERRPEAMWRLTEAGASAYVGPDKAVAHADVVITMLPDAAAVMSVAIGQEMLAALRQGTIWAQMGTVGVGATQQLAASGAYQRSDVLFVDSSVPGTRQPAEAGPLLTLASGPESTRAVLAPVFGAIGSRTLWLGEAGAGSRLNLVLNTWLAFLMAGIAESVADRADPK
jgi:3-hydroxyisobutyrate dehydrogenase